MTPEETTTQPRYDAVLFDLLTALLDSWSLWAEVAGDAETGRRWRMAYLDVTYSTGAYRAYDEIVAEATERAGLPARLTGELLERWPTLRPWPEVPEVLSRLAERMPLGVVTNCSTELGHVAAALCRAPFTEIVTTEEAGFYKPDPRVYLLALERLGTTPERTLFVAGSPGDVGGASALGMPVVWHNRVGLAGATATPLAEITDLTELLALL